MAFTNRLATVVAGFGSPISNDTQNQRAGVSLSGASTTTTIPSSGSFSPAPRSGWVRVKLYNGGSAGTLGTVAITATDGTNTVYIGGCPVAQAVPNVAASGIDIIVPFLLDIVPTSITITVALTVGTTTCSMDAEISYSN